MLNWLLRKRSPPGAPQPMPAPADTSARTPASRADASTGPAAVPDAHWDAKLGAALHDESALLQLAGSASPLRIKLAAVQALASEAALKQAEREFRSHDRKVHRLAKQRLDAAVAQREARAKAQTLLERARSLRDQGLLPVNHVLALDRDWQALPAQALEPAQQAEFAELRSSLDALMRERGDAQQRLQRWSADAKRFLQAWPQTLRSAAAHGSAGETAELGRSIEAMQASRPEAPAAAELDLALARALRDAALVQSCLAGWETPTPETAELASTPSDASASSESAPAFEADPAQLDAGLVQLLKERHAQWLRQHQPTPAVAAVVAPGADEAARSARQALKSAAHTRRLETLVQQAEAALAAGRLGELQRPLQAIEATLAQTHAGLPDPLRERFQVLRAERGRLKDWQQWGTARARDDLMKQAQALARRALACTDSDAPDRPKLNLREHAQDIQALRLRWKELDHQGAVASQEAWQAFDAELHTAHQPVATQHAALKAARQENLLAREALLGALEAEPDLEAPDQVADRTVDWREPVRALERFHNAWRKLGPVEHTVPIEAREALQQRWHSAVARIEAPLQRVRDAATAQRELLVTRAQGLVATGGGGRPVSDAARQVRELQAEWQDQARRLPLSRGAESALWARFKAATDAVFVQRDAAHAARAAELAANLAHREALLQRLSALDAESTPAEIERTLAEVDRAWRIDCELPRGAGDGLDARFRSARAAASRLQGAGLRRHWEAQCDALAARLGLCEEREDGAAVELQLAGRWASQARLPSRWEQALALRWERSPEAGPLPASEVNELLLRLEAALDMPVAPEWQAARQGMKLRALKEAMEGRKQHRQGPAEQADWLLAVLYQSGLDTAQRARLHALLTALRAASVGALGTPAV